mgnify:CR=1 FL=1
MYVLIYGRNSFDCVVKKNVKSIVDYHANYDSLKIRENINVMLLLYNIMIVLL